MTCIVGLVKDDIIYIGGDSAGVDDDMNFTIRKDKKVFKKDNMIFGFSGSFRMGQILQYSFNIPYHNREFQSDFNYLCSEFIDELIDCFKNKGFATIEDDVVTGGFFLLGYNNNLYHVQNDFQIAKVYRNFNACGCGENYALGALDIILNDNIITEPNDIIKKALMTVEKFSACVKSPFNIVSLKPTYTNVDSDYEIKTIEKK